MSEPQYIEMLAGVDAQGSPIIEKIPVHINDQNECELAHSPAFVKGVARGDLLKLNSETQQFEVKKRSGNLCVRVFCRGDIDRLGDNIAPELEKLGGQLDLATPRMLVYSIHVSCGFNAIEDIFNRHCQSGESGWIYGNVYDPNDGATPLNWWAKILQPE